MIVRYHLLSVLRYLIIFSALCLAAVTSIEAADARPQYLSGTLADRITVTQDWGSLGFDTAVKPQGREAAKLRIKDKHYEHGLGHHANGEIVVPLEGQFQTFACQVGIQWQGGQNIGSVIFQIYVDGKKVFQSGVVRENDPPREVCVSVAGADELRLVATDAGDSIMCDFADWADARLIPDPTAKDRIARRAVDIAAFARIVTSDPKRMRGTAATRVQELPAEDVFLETELLPAADGSYSLPVSPGASSCIGLRWYEPRQLRRLELRLAEGTAAPLPSTVQLQHWVGVSPWQGRWEPLPAKFEQSPSVWGWNIAARDQPAGTVRLRWVFPATQRPLVFTAISAYSRSSWSTANLRAQWHGPMAAKPASIAIYNGDLLTSAEQVAPRTHAWDLTQPAILKVRYSRPKANKTDRTVLRFELPAQATSVAVEDVVEHGCVYVPSAGLFVTIDPPPMTLTQYLERIAGKQTVLEQVRRHPDQIFSQAMAKTHNPIQNNGPMLLSLACDNRKFIVERTGVVGFNCYDAPDGAYPALVSPKEWWYQPKSDKPYSQLVPQFGGGSGEVSRHLDGGWLPKPVITVTDSGVKYRQCTYVAPLDAQPPAGSPNCYRQRAVCVAQYAIENISAADAEASLRLTLSATDGKTKVLDGIREVENGVVAVIGDRVLAVFDAAESAPLKLVKQADGVRLAGTLAPGKSARLAVYMPAWPVKPGQYAVLENADHRAAETEAYWKEVLAGAMQIDIPDPLLANVIRAAQVHCMMAARNEQHGRLVAPWAASMVYGPLESEGEAVIRGMDMCGHADFARRGLEFFLSRYNAQGFLTTGYTVVGTGEHLWTLAEHHARCGDRDWLTTVAPQLVRACKWIVRQREKTKRRDARGDKVPEYGLMPPGVAADWERYAYRVFNDAQYCHGLETVAQALSEIGHPDAPALLADAKCYREDLLRAYRWTRARCPVVKLANGCWVPNYPSMLDVFGNIEEMLPAEDASRSWAYSVEIGAHHLTANRLLDPRSGDVTQIMDYLEDHQFLRSGMGDYPEQQNRADIFNSGGFAKVQPYYARNAEVYALRDDVKPFLRSYFNALSAMISEENLSHWEHFHNSGAWNKTHETGWFLCQTATMFSIDHGDELWLAPMVTSGWLQDGMKIDVRNAPTRFGKVSYRITSAVAHGHIDAQIEPPSREPPKRLLIRLRHPDGKPIRSVTVNGKPCQDFDPQKQCVSIPPAGGRVSVRVDY